MTAPLDVCQYQAQHQTQILMARVIGAPRCNSSTAHTSEKPLTFPLTTAVHPHAHPFLPRQQMREIIQDFYNSRYASCLSKLATLRPILMLDLHLAEHVDPLYAAIRQRALVQYTIPFLSVDMNTMAEALNTNVR